MPLINPPKLSELYATTFFYPSSITATPTPSTGTVLMSDGNGGTFFSTVVGSGGGGGGGTGPTGAQGITGPTGAQGIPGPTYLYFAKTVTSDPTNGPWDGTLVSLPPDYTALGYVTKAAGGSQDEAIGPRYYYSSITDILPGAWNFYADIDYTPGSGVPPLYFSVDVNNTVIFRTSTLNAQQFANGKTTGTGYVSSYVVAKDQSVGVTLKFDANYGDVLNYFTNFTDGASILETYIYTTNMLPGPTGATGPQGIPGTATNTGATGATGPAGASSLDPNLVVSSLVAQYGISTVAISTSSVYANSISTYSLTIYGPTTLTSQGENYFTGPSTFFTGYVSAPELFVSSINGQAYTSGGGGGSVSDQFSTLFTSSLAVSTIVFDKSGVQLRTTGTKIAIGSNAGANAQNPNTIAIGPAAGQNGQTNFAIAIGASAGGSSQQGYAIAIGNNAGNDTQAQNAIAIGRNAGTTSQSENAIAIGTQAGAASQSTNAIAIGYQAQINASGSNSIAIGAYADANGSNNSTIILNASGQVLNSQQPNSFYVDPIRGATTGNVLYYNTTSKEITYGAGGGSGTVSDQFSTLFTSSLALSTITFNSNIRITDANGTAIAIGYGAGSSSQSTNSIAMGTQAGETDQQNNSIAIGRSAGRTNQTANSVAIGNSAGETDQQNNSIAIGRSAGQTNQNTNSVAIGGNAGNLDQGSGSVAIGSGAGNTNQSTNAIAIGLNAQVTKSGDNSIAIGAYADTTGVYESTIVLNASGQPLTTQQAASFYVDPIRGATTGNVLYYDTGTKEITYGAGGGGNGTFSGVSSLTISTGSIYAQSISTYSLTVFGPSTLIVQGVTFLSGATIFQGSTIFTQPTTSSGPATYGTPGTTSTFTENAWYAVGLATGNTTSSILKSIDNGTTWSAVNISGSATSVNALANNGTRLVAGTGDGNIPIITSTDGSNWTFASTTNPFTTSVNCMDIQWNGTTFLACMTGNGTLPRESTIITSSDGLTWSSAKTGAIFSYKDTPRASKAIWTGSAWYVGGDSINDPTSTILKSTDGVNYEAVGLGAIPNKTLTSLAYNGTYYLAGFSMDPTTEDTTSTICKSTDGQTWTAAGFGYSSISFAVTFVTDFAWDGTKWLAVGLADDYTSSIHSSTDGENWTPSLLSGAYPYNTVSGNSPNFTILYQNSTWYVGGTSTDLTSSIIKSTDGTSWTTATNGANMKTVVNLVSTGTFNGSATSASLFTLISSGTISTIDMFVNTLAFNSNIRISDTNGNSVAIGKSAGQTNQNTNSVAIGNSAGETDQQNNSIAIGRSAGRTNQNTNSVAIGGNAGNLDQGSGSVAIGINAGTNTQASSAVAIGNQAGYGYSGPQNADAIAIGREAQYNQSGLNSIAIGTLADNAGGYDSTIVINATGGPLNSQQGNSFYVAPIRNDATPTDVLYYNTGTNEITYGAGGGISAFSSLTLSSLTVVEGISTVNISTGSIYADSISTSHLSVYGPSSLIVTGNAFFEQQIIMSSIVITGQLQISTSGSGTLDTSSASISSLTVSSINGQPYTSGGGGSSISSFITLATSSFLVSTITFSSNISIEGTSTQIGIGQTLGGRTGQGSAAIAIGTTAGLISQHDSAVAIGQNAGYTGQLGAAVAIGLYAGETNQSNTAVAIGQRAGNTYQGFSAVAIGDRAGYSDQGISAVAIGSNAGTTSQKDSAIAIGSNAGNTNQSPDAIAIGTGAGANLQGRNAIAIGNGAQAQTSAGNGINSIAIGTNADNYATYNGTIVLNATGTDLLTGQDSSFYVAPIRNSTTPGDILYYNTGSSEITYGSIPIIQGGSSTTDNVGLATITFDKQYTTMSTVVVSLNYPASSEAKTFINVREVTNTTFTVYTYFDGGNGSNTTYTPFTWMSYGL
jgi:hypothetical protein